MLPLTLATFNSDDIPATRHSTGLVRIAHTRHANQQTTTPGSATDSVSTWYSSPSTSICSLSNPRRTSFLWRLYGNGLAHPPTSVEFIHSPIVCAENFTQHLNHLPWIAPSGVLSIDVPGIVGRYPWKRDRLGKALGLLVELSMIGLILS